MWLGLVDIWTRRATEGIARCEHALDLDRNIAQAHSLIGYGKLFVGRAEETEPHIAEALRLSPRDPGAFAWMSYAGMSKNVPGSYEQAVAWFRRSIEANRKFSASHFFTWPPPSRTWVDLTRRVPRPRPVSLSTRPTPSRATAPSGQALATTRRFWPSLSSFSKACAKPEPRTMTAARRNAAILAVDVDPPLVPDGRG